MSEIQVGDGFRLLTEGEIVRSSDQWNNYGDWEPALRERVGHPLPEYLRPYRRKITAPKVCGCGKHEVAFGADPYAAHRDYLENYLVVWGGGREALGFQTDRGLRRTHDQLTIAVEIQHEDFV